MNIISHREYCLALLPEEHELFGEFLVNVAYRGKNRWAILRGGFCLNDMEEWDWEPTNSSRSDQWLSTHRFDEHTALMLASRALLRHRVQGRTAEQWAND